MGAAQSPSDPSTCTVVTVGELRRWRQSAINAAQSTEEADIEVDWLLQELAQVSKLSLRFAADNDPLSLACSLAQLDKLWQRRIRERSPLQYLVGHTPWRNLQLQVGPGVLIPRPETELLIDLVKQQIQSQSLERQKTLKQGPWVDLGTGSGAIALGLAATFEQMQIHAVDCSPEALAIAQSNITTYSDTYRLQNRLHLHRGNWLESLPQLRGQLQGLASNPPYIPSETIATLQTEVQHHEPHLALDGGNDGLDCLRHLVKLGAEFLVPGGFWAVELMAGQAPAVKDLLESQGGYESIGHMSDLAGIERFVWAYRCND